MKDKARVVVVVNNSKDSIAKEDDNETNRDPESLGRDVEHNKKVDTAATQDMTPDMTI